MGRIFRAILACTIVSASCNGVAAAAEMLEQVTVAYFLKWPTANQVAQSEQWYDEAMGVKINWRAFNTGKEMADAMAAGEVDIAYSMGLVPFTVAVSNGVPIKAVGVAVTYGENDNCVIHKNVAIDKANAHELQGKRVAVPFGTVAHYKMLRTLRFLGVDVKAIQLVDMNPDDGAKALADEKVTMACGWGGALWDMKKHGYVLMSAEEQEKLGLRVFDVTAVTSDFAEKHGDLVVKFLEVTDRAAKFLEDEPEEAKPIIAEAAGMTLKDSNIVLSLFEFPLRDEQLSAYWLRGSVQAFAKEVADFFVAQGEMPKALDDYSPAVDAGYYEKVGTQGS
jgi:taurine transport system substrate-binding protein